MRADAAPRRLIAPPALDPCRALPDVVVLARCAVRSRLPPAAPPGYAFGFDIDRAIGHLVRGSPRPRPTREIPMLPIRLPFLASLILG